MNIWKSEMFWFINKLTVKLYLSNYLLNFKKKELLRYSKSLYFDELKLKDKDLLNAVQSDFERDEDEPLSIKSLSITFVGITIAFLIVLIPSISVLIDKPISQENEIISNQSLKKDGP